MNLTVVLPTKNEAGTIGDLIDRVREECDTLGTEYEILVMDAGSSDQTREIAEQKGARVDVQKRIGYAGAILDALDAAQGERVLTIDADFSHPPRFIRSLWAVRDFSDLAIASRFVSGGKADMDMMRYTLSRVLNLTFRLLTRTPVFDLSSGYRLYKKDLMARYKFEGENLSILQDMVVKLHANGHTVMEVPFHYMPRRAGVSKSQVLKFGPSYLATLWRLFAARITGARLG